MLQAPSLQNGDCAIVYVDIALVTLFLAMNTQVCALLFCWTGVLGVGGGCHALSADCLARRRSDAVAAARSLSLKVGPRRLHRHHSA